MASFSDSAFAKDIAFSSLAFSFGTPTTRTFRPGYDPKREIIMADDKKVLEAITDFLRKQPWRKM